MSHRPNQKPTKKGASSAKAPQQADDFVSVARRLGADEDKARFEAKLGKLAAAKQPDRKP
jgi:hypothetical protein